MLWVWQDSLIYIYVFIYIYLFTIYKVNTYSTSTNLLISVSSPTDTERDAFWMGLKVPGWCLPQKSKPQNTHRFSDTCCLNHNPKSVFKKEYSMDLDLWIYVCSVVTINVFFITVKGRTDLVNSAQKADPDHTLKILIGSNS